MYYNEKNLMLVKEMNIGVSGGQMAVVCGSDFGDYSISIVNRERSADGFENAMLNGNIF